VLTLIVANANGVTTAALSPQTLTFAAQASGTASSPQVVTLTNSGTVAMTLSVISVSGTNAGDFSQANNCGTQVAAGASCQINVTFTPTGLGARSASLIFSDNANGSPQMVALAGSGPDFSMDAGTTSSATVSKGQTASYTLSIVPAGGFAQNVSLACTGAPALATCTVSPNTISLSGTSAATATVTVTTTAASHSAAPFFNPSWPHHGPLQQPALLAALFGTLSLLLLVGSGILLWPQ